MLDIILQASVILFVLGVFLMGLDDNNIPEAKLFGSGHSKKIMLISIVSFIIAFIIKKF